MAAGGVTRSQDQTKPHVDSHAGHYCGNQLTGRSRDDEFAQHTDIKANALLQTIYAAPKICRRQSSIRYFSEVVFTLYSKLVELSAKESVSGRGCAPDPASLTKIPAD